MDRSFLSDASVIAAARAFVCIRLLTYESADEAKVLTGVFVGRSGELENSTFALLSSDGRRKLTRAGRSPDMVFRGSDDETPVQEMARRMREIAAEETARGRSTAAAGAKDGAAGVVPATLPSLADVRLALNVASCDQTPLVVVRGRDAKDVAALEERLLPVAWSDALRGRFAYASTHDARELEPLGDVPAGAAYVVVAPDTWGLAGRVLGTAATDATPEALSKLLADALDGFRPESKDTRRHVAEGRSEGAHWQSAIPVTDPGPGGRDGDRGPPPR